MSQFLRRTILDVPFREKDEAKALGAWWDPDIRKWYIPQGCKPESFKKWLPQSDEKDGASAANGEPSEPA